MKSAENPTERSLAEMMGQVVVLDTKSPYIYIGALAGADEYFYVLKDAELRDSAEGHSPKEKYLLDAAVHGHLSTRGTVYVRAEQVLSISRLADIRIVAEVEQQPDD